MKSISERFDELVPKLFTEDGLLPTQEMVARPNGEIYLRREPQLRLYPHQRAEQVVKLLRSNEALWDCGAIRVRSTRPVVGRAPVYGVPFAKAVGIVLQQRLHKSRFWIEHPNGNSLYAQLMVHLWKRKESNGNLLSFESWQ
jgi:hypothetical protein